LWLQDEAEAAFKPCNCTGELVFARGKGCKARAAMVSDTQEASRRQKVTKPLTCCYETRRDTAAALRSRRRLLINCGVEANVSKTCSSSSLVFFPLRRDDSHSLE
jgi:hypothetical protein